MRKGLKIVLFVISLLVIFLISCILFYINCIQKARDVSLFDDIVIRKYIELFYNQLGDPPLRINSWFLNDEISFYIQGNYTYIERTNNAISGNAESPESFEELFKSFSEYAGTMQNYYVSSIEYYLQPYDLGESNIYFLSVETVYKNLKANEFFWLKNVDGEWSIFRYWIEYYNS